MLHLSPYHESAPLDENFDVFGGTSTDNICTEEGDDGDVYITSAELIKRMKKLWTNEKLCPELLPFDDAIVDAVVAQIDSMEAALETRIAATKGKSAYADMALSLHSSEVARIRFILTDYHRIRIKKIEAHLHYVLERDQQHVYNDLALLSEAERAFAVKMKTAMESYFRGAFLESLPSTIQEVAFNKIAKKPDVDSYVFFRVERTVSSADFGAAILQSGGNTTDIGDGLSLSSGDQHVMIYRNVASLLKDDAVSLMS